MNPSHPSIPLSIRVPQSLEYCLEPRTSLQFVYSKMAAETPVSAPTEENPDAHLSVAKQKKITAILRQQANLQKQLDELRAEEEEDQGQDVNPFSVTGELGTDGKLKPIDYDKLVKQFGTSRIDDDMLKRFERVTGHKPHRYLRRGIVFSHRDLGLILDRHEQGKPFFLYTGRGPSSDSMHIGHTTPFAFTKYLQDVFDVPLVIMLTDDEKFLFNADRKLEDTVHYAQENIRDIIAVGFDPKKTFIFTDFEYIGGIYKNACRIAKVIPFNQVRGAFDFNESDNIGKIFYPSVQAAASFATTFPHIFGTDEKKVASIPCLIPCAIDQDPYFRLTRDNAQKIKLGKVKYQRPALIHSVFLPALQGFGTKMSASDLSSAIYMTDTPKQIKAKINAAISGGAETEEEHRRLGGNVEQDVPFRYLQFFLEDDVELERIRVAYSKGEMMTGALKKICTDVIQEYVKEFQVRRTLATDAAVSEFKALRPLVWGGNPNPIMPSAGDQPKEIVLKALSQEPPKEPKS
ncbi:MAG: hypothetical protein M1829_002276 [Trizodia sp. TS-e1964]|nr:MAG: hypothetical protein M1829_002276 [Trizodia sp. TS-e1964]